MSISGKKGRATGRRPSLGGVLMQDVSNGRERVRKWPRARGSTQSPKVKANQAKFRNVQMATKYIAPQMYLDIMKSVEGTPLLPRDIMTMMFYQRLVAFVLPGERILWPMTAKREVEQALDTISQEDGTTLVRENGEWVAKRFSDGGGALSMIANVDLAGLPEYVTPDLSRYKMAMFIFSSYSHWGGDWMRGQLSYDDGYSYVTGQGDYQITFADGNTAESPNFSPLGARDKPDQSGVVVMINADEPASTVIWNPQRNETTQPRNVRGPCTNMRLHLDSGRPLREGVLTIFAF